MGRGHDLKAAADLLGDLLKVHVEIVLEGSSLRWRAPFGVMTPELKDVVTRRRLDIIAVLAPNVFGAGRPSPENANRSKAERLQEARKLLLWLTDFFNERLSILQFEAGFSEDEALKRAKAETVQTEAYRSWRALG